MKKQPFDFKIAVTRWFMGILVGLAVQLMTQLQGGALITEIRWAETLTAVITGFLSALIADLSAWNNWPPPSEEE